MRFCPVLSTHAQLCIFPFLENDDGKSHLWMGKLIYGCSINQRMQTHSHRHCIATLDFFSLPTASARGNIRYSTADYNWLTVSHSTSMSKERHNATQCSRCACKPTLGLEPLLLWKVATATNGVQYTHLHHTLPKRLIINPICQCLTSNDSRVIPTIIDPIHYIHNALSSARMLI